MSRLLSESLKHINLNLIQAIHKQFNTQINEHINQIFLQAMNQAQSSNRAYNYNKDNRFINEQQNQHSPRQSQNGNSSNKNLRRTGYFGQVTKPTLTIRLDDIQKKFSTQIPQNEINIDNSFDQKPKSVSQQKKRLFRGDTFSQISEQAEATEEYAFRTLQPSYPRNQQRKRSLERHSRNQGEHMGCLQLNESITEDLKRVKLSLKEQKSQTSSREYQNQIQTYERPYNHQFPNSQNVNYSFSEMNNWNAFDQNEDRSSVTTYQKSENNYNRDPDRYTTKNTYSYYRPPTDRSEKSQKSSSQRQDIIQKIKERVRLKLKSKEKYKQEITRNQPSYGGHNVENSLKRHSYHEAEYEQAPKPIRKEDMILADFYERHSIKNPVVTQHQTQRKMSPVPASRSPSNTRSRSPSSSSTSRVTNTHNIRPGINKYTPVINTPSYGVGNQSIAPTTIVSRSTFSKSMVDRPEFSAYSKRANQPNTNTATYQTNITGGYEPKSGLYSINKGTTQNTSSYVKKY